ncbi:WD40 repeat protein [Phaffia rhodozyma]|uniref:WD40 repeat protein n=1 Tax=Phaffia rhodozyma TaxID=264483 RepID=A0A0F7SRQ3_PHARH|nr:WD40 repeat protein [Phaffia rhodozyma]
MVALPLHRVRFVDYQPQSITQIAFPPLPLRVSHSSAHASSSSSKEPEVGLMAVGKGSGEVEIHKWVERKDGGQGWVILKRLVPPKSTKIDSLVFTLRRSFIASGRRIAGLGDVRLFSSGGSSDLVEWDLTNGSVMRLHSSQSGSIWSIAPNPSSTILAIGCEDGSLRLLSLENDEDLVHIKKFERTKSRLLSIAWGPSLPPLKKTASAAKVGSDEVEESSEDEDEAEWRDSWLVTGCSDSCLRKWDFNTGRVVERMIVEREKAAGWGNGKRGATASKGRSVVWCVGVLRDGTIASGDSLGIVRFWDAVTATQICSFKAHAADVLCLGISPEQTSVFTSGIDQTTIQFALVSSPQSQRGQWIQSTSKRMHTHDVLALAIYPPALPVNESYIPKSPDNLAPILVTGGVDTTLVFSACSNPGLDVKPESIGNPLLHYGSGVGSTVFGEAFSRRTGGLNGVGADGGGRVMFSRGARWIMVRREEAVGIWRINEKVEGEEESAWEKVLEMELKGQSELISAAVSEDGSWVVASDLEETKLFYIAASATNPRPHLIRSLTTSLESQCPSLPLASQGTSASALAFTPDSTKLILATSRRGDVIVLDLADLMPDADIVVAQGEDDPMDEPVERKEKKWKLGEVRVLRVFEQSKDLGTRVVVGSRKVKSADEESIMDGDELSPNASGALTNAGISIVSVAHDGQWFAVVDLSGRTRVYNLDTLQLHAHLPTFPGHPPAAIAFLPNPITPNTSVLCLALPSGNQLHVYDVEKRRFPSEFNIPSPAALRNMHDPVLGLSIDPNGTFADRKEGLVLMWGATWTCRVQLSNGQQKQPRKKAKRNQNGDEKEAIAIPDADQSAAEANKAQQRMYKLGEIYRPVIGLDYIGPSELVVVERPRLDLVKNLPPSYFKVGRYRS